MDEAASFLFLWRITSWRRLFTSGLKNKVMVIDVVFFSWEIGGISLDTLPLVAVSYFVHIFSVLYVLIGLKRGSNCDDLDLFGWKNEKMRINRFVYLLSFVYLALWSLLVEKRMMRMRICLSTWQQRIGLFHLFVAAHPIAPEEVANSNLVANINLVKNKHAQFAGPNYCQLYIKWISTKKFSLVCILYINCIVQFYGTLPLIYLTFRPAIDQSISISI